MNFDNFAFLVGGFCLGLLAGMFYGEYAAEQRAIANTGSNTVTDKVTNTVTETEVYKAVCVVDAEGYCKEYSVRRLNKE